VSGEPYVEVVDEETLARRVAGLAEEVNTDYAGKEPVLVGVLGGCVPFLADLVRHLDLPIEIDFLALTRFGTEGRVGIAMDTGISLQGRDVVIVEDIVDTGLTLATLRRVMETRGVASLSTVALLDKVTRRIVDVPVEYRGFEVGDEYLLGYGLDWDGRYRNVRSLWAVMDLGTLADAPESFVPMGLGDRSTPGSAAEGR
jgi:hypoxanthine phosphoribosyltransferase